MLFQSKKPHYEHLRRKLSHRHRQSTQNLFDRHLRRVAAGSLGGLMLMTTSGSVMPDHNSSAENHVQITGSTNNNIGLSLELKQLIPSEVRPLTPEEESQIAAKIGEKLGIKVTAEIGDKRLNRSYGLMGGEQHLYRYPGDTVMAQSKTTSDWAMFGSAGMAPGLGAWGYFAQSKDSMTPEQDARERWYIAVQTFLSPGFSERVAEYRDFYKYRKMLVVNPKTGQAVVVNIADAGPSEWTGKSLGGSPEVMHELGIAGGPRKGAILYFFIDDSQKDLPLGPVKVNSQEIALSN